MASGKKATAPKTGKKTGQSIDHNVKQATAKSPQRKPETKNKARAENKPQQNKKPTTPRVRIEPQKPDTHTMQEDKKQSFEPTRYSDDKLSEFEVIILNRKAIAEKEYKFLKGLVSQGDEDVTPVRTMSFDAAADHREKEQNALLAGRQLELIKKLDGALQRIKNKTYGICRVTQKLIDENRLRAVPHATTTVEGKDLANKVRA